MYDILYFFYYIFHRNIPANDGNFLKMVEVQAETRCKWLWRIFCCYGGLVTATVGVPVQV